MNKVKELLKEAGRYDEIIDIIKNIAAKKESSFPVDPFRDYDGNTQWRIDGEDLRNEAKVFLNIIESEDGIPEVVLENLYHYVNTETDMLLHNYAVSVSHRHTPEEDMERIRCWEILDNLLVCQFIGDNYCCDEFPWYIPDGWKAERKEASCKGVVIRSDYSNKNTLTITQKEDGDIVIHAYIGDEDDKNVIIATSQGGSRINHNAEIIKHFRAIIDLLGDGTERDDIVRVLK